MLNGTHHFRTESAAKRYFNRQGDGADVQLKIAEGAIAVGPPDMTKWPLGATWSWDGDGRALVETTR